MFLGVVFVLQELMSDVRFSLFFFFLFFFFALSYQPYICKMVIKIIGCFSWISFCSGKVLTGFLLFKAGVNKSLSLMFVFPCVFALSCRFLFFVMVSGWWSLFLYWLTLHLCSSVRVWIDFVKAFCLLSFRQLISPFVLFSFSR